VASLVIDGQLRLSERYVMQKGQLVNVQNSLASEVVSTFTASGKYLIFVTEKSIDKVAGIMGAPFINALGDVCVTAKLDDAAIRKIAEGELAELKEKAKERFFFDVEPSEDFLDYSVTKSERQAGLKGVRDFYDGVLQALAQAKLENDYPKDAKMLLSIEDGRVMAKHEESVIDLTALLPEGYRGEIDEIRKEMDEIVGLAKVKEYVMGLEEYYKVQKRRSEEGLKVSELSKHMIFTGNPGTGKTTIARIISKYLKSIGVLTGGQLVEVSRADLVGRYVGHTAPLTNKVISSAIGGVLFIDEAYSLYRGRDDSFGLEAIDTLVKGIEDNRDNLIVILAGYSKEMEQFLTSNSGLKSRFPNVIHFPDYTGEELLLISKSIAKSKGYTIDEGADPALLAYFNAVQAVRATDAGNGRLARNKIEEAVLNQSKRLVAEPDAELSVLLSQDFDLNDVMSGEK
jgi:AAA+ superfamily predicted ATPase